MGRMLAPTDEPAGAPDSNAHDAPRVAASRPAPRTRRAVLGAALGGVAGALAGMLGRPDAAKAAAGDALVIGQTNFGGSSATRLNTTSSGGAFWMTQYGFGSGVRADSVNGHGVVATTTHADRHAVHAEQNAAALGTGAAVFGDGGSNTGVSGLSTSRHGVYGESSTSSGVYGFSATGTGVTGVSNTWGIYGLGTQYAAYLDGAVYVAKHVDLPEVTPPASPSADRARLFVRDNGSGKTQVCVMFADGSIQVLTTQA